MQVIKSRAQIKIAREFHCREIISFLASDSVNILKNVNITLDYGLEAFRSRIYHFQEMALIAVREDTGQILGYEGALLGRHTGGSICISMIAYSDIEILKQVHDTFFAEFKCRESTKFRFDGVSDETTNLVMSTLGMYPELTLKRETPTGMDVHCYAQFMTTKEA